MKFYPNQNRKMTADEYVPKEIEVISAYKSYDGNTIINGLNMCVPSGSIYCLLGASGCGKSTLLQCILGKTTLDFGVIHLKSHCLKDIGYMPQDLCLEVFLTTKELFDYYGTLYEMSKNEIEFRANSLIKFLQLPNINEYIKNLSGGEVRRVSLAVSIFHDPRLIVLDEPTVGIDLLLGHKIWDEFSSMVEHGKKTIIITTHYIEEAAKANFVGLMRNGIIMEEGQPKNIMANYKTDSLESTFLILCYKLKEHKDIQNEFHDVQQKKVVCKTNKLYINSGKSISLNRIKSLIKKNLNLIYRDYILLMTMIVIPIICTLVICFGIGTYIKNLKIAVKSDEVKLTDCHNFKNDQCILNETNNQTMSCFIMNYLLSKNYQLIEVKDRVAGETTIRNYESLAFLYFSHDYTKYLSFYIGDNPEDYYMKSPIYMNFARDNVVLKNQILKDVTDSLEIVTEETLDNCSYNPKSLSMPINFNVILGKEVKSLLDYVVTIFFASKGYLLFSTFSISLMTSERMDGYFSRSMFAGVKITELLISLFCTCNMIYVLQLVPTFFIVYVLFSNTILVNGSIALFFLSIFLVGWIGFFCGILISVILPTKLCCTYVEYAIFLGQILLSGFMWPISGQVFWLRPLSELLPVTLAANTMNNTALRGWTWDHPSVMFDMIMMVTELILSIIMLYVFGHLKRDMWILNK